MRITGKLAVRGFSRLIIQMEILGGPPIKSLLLDYNEPINMIISDEREILKINEAKVFGSKNLHYPTPQAVDVDRA